MTDIKIDKQKYVPPELVVVEATELLANLGPIVSCSGYGGSTSGC